MVREIDAFFAADVSTFVQRLHALDEQLRGRTDPQDDDHLRELSDAIAASCVACREMEALLSDDSALLKEVQERFRVAIRPYFDQSWFMEQPPWWPSRLPANNSRPWVF